MTRRRAEQVTPGLEPPRAEINVTPLVDVCLVLLIIFMVVTPMIRDGVEVALPDAARPAPIPERPGQIVVSVQLEGSVWVNETRVGSDGLAAALRRLGASESGREVLVRGDRALPYGQVRAVFRRLTEAGVARAALVTLRDERRAGL
ncbi:MAG TPA: biopolymer transporter ExbD [Thermoanaerobaculaceae bacterium]|nr:biopolymer transporter ExbD [Thermoanaerobaculaceae bacterium]